ncbi:cohesin complex subunit SCC1 [Geosmithia morbida]|uniref:Cohesin complex subunit SCC1 n=1 Tax=Geosmithia morbida TaxID=1094350 RepID=A0A9P4YY77_9HYPO|nr:cohesin complex subunit SCC1 [Geosmithia morbida]KAF4123982.1 cohesin complex subunit SCC1 [Geosmithia morbida]
MFYSETLLQKSGPLARVWLSANIERKLSKNSVLQSNVTDSVEEIIKPTHAPLALRLSSQLLLGVVRIYQRKTRYLLDDCNEAMMKIKMAFRSSGNNDMAAGLAAPNREALLLPDRITPYDNLDLPPPPDASWLLAQPEDVTATPVGRKGRVSNRDINLQEDFDNSHFLQNPIEEETLGNMDDLELDLDFGLDDTTALEVGRDAPDARPVEDDILSDFGAGLRQKDHGDREVSLNPDFGDEGPRIADNDGDIAMGGDDDFDFNAGDQSAVPQMTAAPELNRARISESPLSDIDEAFAREVEADYASHRQTDMYEPEDETETTLVRRPANRAKKQKLLVPDDETTLSSNHIKQQQVDHTNIIRDTTFLPSDPFLLTLMDLQRSGGFVSSVLMDGRGMGWAPELRGMLSLDTIRSMHELKRKRDSGIADVDSEQGNVKSPRLELGDEEEEDTVIAPPGLGNQSVAGDGSLVQIPAADDGDGDDNEGSGLPGFDEGNEPSATLPRGEDEPVSLGTKHAVHVLRDLFGDEAATSERKRKEKSVVFQDLLPEKRATKAEATKMFFECLVLATKDAIRVEQGPDLGAPIRVRGKPALWGSWAEREAGGEIASQEEDEAQDDAPERPATAAQPVAVGA